jgi:hypothetical protein
MTNINNLKLNGIIIAIFFISLDAYSLGNIPIQWIGLSLLLLLFIFNFKKITSNFSSIVYLVLALVILPIFFEIFSNFEILLERNYQLRLFNYFSFFLVIYVSHSFLQTIDLKLFMDQLEKLLIIISVISIYIYLSQIFDLYEPIRNRSNTNLLGNDAQSVFWPYEPHRAMGTFREPVLFVSYVFPLSLILLFGKKNISSISILIIALSLGLTRSDLLRIFAITGIVLFFIFYIFNKSQNNKIILFLSGALLFTFISIQECKINPTSNECLEISVEESKELITFEDIGTITELDSDRKNIIDFLSSRDMNFFGQGFNSIVQDYQQYLTKEINKEMYLTNRVLPNYLDKRYQSENFGTGNYSSNFYKPNTQSLLVNTIISSGLILLLVLISFPIYKFLIKRDYESLLKILFLILFFFVIPVEEFNAFTGLILGYGFRMFNMGVLIDKSI